jgi:hypothetical protein
MRGHRFMGVNLQAFDESQRAQGIRQIKDR